MNEYNLNYNENTENNEDTKKPKKRVGLKIAAALMAFSLVSAGSIGIYSRLDDTSDKSVSASEEAEPSEPGKKSNASASAEKINYIAAQQKDGIVITTEEIVEKMLPTVVGIESSFTSQSSANSFGFGYGFGGGTPSQSKATGTGVVITKDGYIVTNAHVIYDTQYGSGLADSISVLMNDEKSYDAEVIGYDTDCDLAVLKIDADNLTAAELGDSDNLRLGESVIAIGNPLGFELMNTVTKGIVSGKNRRITINDKSMNLIQTDAAINSGNSGGPLIDMNGKVIGINSSKMSSSYSATSIEGIGFAIPSNEVSKIVEDLMKYGYVTGKPQFGISAQDVTETISNMYNLPLGAYITAVEEGSAADEAGLIAGDVITGADGETITTVEELNIIKNKHTAGDEIEITYVRNGKTQNATVTLGESESSK